MTIDEEETHLLDPNQRGWGNWPSEANWPAGKEIVWDGREPTTRCSRSARFVVPAEPGEVSTCTICTAREKAAQK